MTTIPPERVKELIEWAEKTLELHRLRCDLAATWGVSDTVAEADLLSILSSYSSMRAENERLKNNWDYWQQRALKKEAQLAKQAPLIQAVMGVGIDQLRAGVVLHTVGMCRPVLAAALALREGEK